MNPFRCGVIAHSFFLGFFRRDVLRGFAIAMIGLSQAHIPRPAEAKKKKKCGLCRRQKKGRCKPRPDGATCVGGTCHGGNCVPDASPSPSLPPPITGPGFCNFVEETLLSGTRRWAQTFFPPHSGQLTMAQIYLRQNPISFNFELQIRTVDSAGVPTSEILASEKVIVPTATATTDPPYPAFTFFSPPAPIIVGQQYAVVIESITKMYSVKISHKNDNPCPDGNLFRDSEATDAFTAIVAGLADMAFEVEIAP